MSYQNTHQYPNANPQYPNFYEQRVDVANMQYTHPNEYAATSGGQAPAYPQEYDSGNINPYQGFPFIPTPTVSDIAMGYGPTVMVQGSDYVKKTKWSVQFDTSGPVPPGDDINAPDLYIPLLAFITYILVSGAILGMQSSFSPEQLGILSTEAFGWLVLEVLLFIFCVYVINQQSNLTYLDLIALSGYKFVSMIAILLGYIFLDKTGYYFTLLYTSIALAYFLIRTLKVKMQPNTDRDRRWAYLLLLIALVQPAIMWWLTRRVVFASTRAF